MKYAIRFTPKKAYDVLRNSKWNLFNSEEPINRNKKTDPPEDTRGPVFKIITRYQL